MGHVSVLLTEVLEALALMPHHRVLDGTINGGGHSEAICRALSEEGILIGLDLDEDALARSEKRLAEAECRVILKRSNFRNFDRVLDEVGVEKVDRILLDLGWSADQLQSGRGFSFQKDEPLLMTFSAEPTTSEFTAEEIINTWDEEHLVDILEGYGDESFASRIAREIVECRAEKAIKTTGQLVRIIEKATPRWYQTKRTHPATKTFQALRIAVNDEMRSLEDALPKALDRLREHGRLAIITFHSREDRIVKQFFKNAAAEGRVTLVSKKPIVPTRSEIVGNPRARSAKLRTLEIV